MSHRNTVTEERLDDLARVHRLSRNQLADAIGLTAREYADRKAGLIPFTAGEINRLAELLYTSVDYLMGRTLDPWPTDNPQPEEATA
jgi:transcriptional regulator with XRE-family HTH domain